MLKQNKVSSEVKEGYLMSRHSTKAIKTSDLKKVAAMLKSERGFYKVYLKPGTYLRFANAFIDLIKLKLGRSRVIDEFKKNGLAVYMDESSSEGYIDQKAIHTILESFNVKKPKTALSKIFNEDFHAIVDRAFDKADRQGLLRDKKTLIKVPI